MALDQYSLAALIDAQMGGNAPKVGGRPVHAARAEYFWSAFGDAFRRAGTLSRLVALLPETTNGAACDPLRDLEPV